MFSLGKKNNVVGFKKPFGKGFIEFEDAPNKLCELGYMSKSQVSISPDMKPEVFCFTSLGAWEPANGKRFYFEVTVISRGIRGTIAIGLSKNEKNAADKQPGWAQGTFGFHGDDGIAFCDDAQAIRGFGPKWAAKGATVGCGVDFEAQSIFFVFPDGTKKTLPTYKMQAFPERFYPMVGMHSPMENVKVNFGTKGIPFVHNPFAEFKIPTFFKFNKKTNAILEGNTLTISAPKRESLQADSFFPRLNTVLPYYEVTILSLQPNDTFSIGFSDQRFESTELVGSMQNSFGYFNNGTVGYNFASDGERGAFKQNDVVGCGVAFDSYNQRKVFYTLNGKIVGYITKRVVAGMDCFPTLGFFGDNIRVRYNFGSAEFVWNVNEWPKPDKTCHISTLPTETLRIILEQASDDVAVTLLVIALVNKQFNKLVSDNNNIWHKLYMQRYPDQNPNLKMQSWAKFFKVRYDMIKERPSDSPIENCEFGYKCPLSLYQLGDAGDGADKRHCNKCDKDVYVVHSKDQLKQYIKLGRCVAFVSPVDNIDVEEMGEEPYYAEEE